MKHKRQRHRFSVIGPLEEEFIINNRLEMSIREMARELGVDRNTITNAIRRIQKGNRNSPPTWPTYVMRNYKELRPGTMARRIGIHASVIVDFLNENNLRMPNDHFNRINRPSDYVIKQMYYMRYAMDMDLQDIASRWGYEKDKITLWTGRNGGIFPELAKQFSEKTEKIYRGAGQADSVPE